jgi:hypothetical protein
MWPDTVTTAIIKALSTAWMYLASTHYSQPVQLPERASPATSWSLVIVRWTGGAATLGGRQLRGRRQIL